MHLFVLHYHIKKMVTNIHQIQVGVGVKWFRFPQVILAMYFFILDKNNERPDWMTDLKHTDSAWFSKVTQVNSL
jgi:hypothetical protein